MDYFVIIKCWFRTNLPAFTKMTLIRSKWKLNNGGWPYLLIFSFSFLKLETASKTGSLIFIFRIFLLYNHIFGFFSKLKCLWIQKQSNKLLVGAHCFTIEDSKLCIVINNWRIFVKLITRWTATGKVYKNMILHLPPLLQIKCLTLLKLTPIV